MKLISIDNAVNLRSARFRYAIASSLASKVTTAAVQIIGIPVAAISLGSHGFALYAMLSAAVGWLALSNLGIGPALVVRLATAHVHGNLADERSIFSSAFFPAFVISAIVSITSLFVVWAFPVENIFGSLYVEDAIVIRSGLTALIAIFFLQINISIFESAQAGYQEQFLQNIISTISSIPCLLAVLYVAKHNPNPVELILALNAPQILFRGGNVIWILWRHPHFFPSTSAIRWPICKALLQSGSIFSLAGGVANFLAHMLPVILIGRAFSSEVSASFAATMNAIILFGGVISMLSTPLWPAIADSVARGDRDWANKAYSRLLWTVMAFAILVALFLALRGEWLFYVWFKGRVNPNQNLLFAAGLYFVAFAWEAAHFTIMVGLHKVIIASILVCGRAVAGILATAIFLQAGNESTPFIMMLISIIVINLIPLRMAVVKNLRP